MTELNPPSTQTKGQLIISLDFELGWGSIENKAWIAREKKGVYKQLRVVLPQLLSLLEDLEIPLTWAYVGAMIEKPSSRSFDHLPDEMTQLIKSTVAGAESTSFDGRDLFESVLNCKTEQHFASHSYSHLRYDYLYADTQKPIGSEFITEDMNLFKKVSDSYGCKIDSLIYPQNIEAFYPELYDLGYRLVRGAPNLSSSKSRMTHLIKSVISPPPLSTKETLDCGLKRHTGSMFFNAGAGRPHRLPFVYRQAISGLKHAMANDGCLHIWIHPFNFADSSLLLPVFGRFLKYAALKRDKGLLDIKVFE